MPITRMSFGEAFQKRMNEDPKLTVADVARKTKVSQPQLQKLKEGKTKRMNSDDAVIVADYFGMTYDEFCYAQKGPELVHLASLIEVLEEKDRAIVRRILLALANSPT